MRCDPPVPAPVSPSSRDDATPRPAPGVVDGTGDGGVASDVLVTTTTVAGSADAGGRLMDVRRAGEMAPGTAIVPRGEAGENFHIRPATEADLPWIDELQKQHRAAVSFLPMMALRGKLELRQILVAEGEGRGSSRTPLAYLIAADRYFKRDEVGYVTQLCVAPQARRSLVAAALLQAQFDRSAYGCRLYSCWCAQDLAANHFWEAMGFVPIAFRTGKRKGKKKDGSGGDDGRPHLFWQKKIRGQDDPIAHWFPHQTGGGVLRADRLVFPMPPGTSWQDVLPIVLPETEEEDCTFDAKQLTDASPERERAGSGGSTQTPRSRSGLAASQKDDDPAFSPPMLRYPDGIEARDGHLWQDGKRLMTREMILREQHASTGSMWFIPDDATMVDALPEPVVVKPKKQRKTARRVEKPIDPRLTAMARELRDRWHERPELAALPTPKHDVRRTMLPAGETLGLPTAGTEPKRLAA